MNVVSKSVVRGGYGLCVFTISLEFFHDIELGLDAAVDLDPQDVLTLLRLVCDQVVVDESKVCAENSKLELEVSLVEEDVLRKVGW
jgi:hypothetical protein